MVPGTGGRHSCGGHEADEISRSFDRVVEERVDRIEGSRELSRQFEADHAEQLGPCGEPSRQGGGGYTVAERRRHGGELGAQRIDRFGVVGVSHQFAAPRAVGEHGGEDTRHAARGRDRVLRGAVAGDRGAVEQHVLVGMVPRPVADGVADGDPLVAWPPRGITGVFGRFAQSVVGVHDERGQQGVPVGEVAVQRGRHHAQLPGDRAQGQCLRTDASQLSAGFVLDRECDLRASAFPGRAMHRLRRRRFLRPRGFRGHGVQSVTATLRRER